MLGKDAMSPNTRHYDYTPPKSLPGLRMSAKHYMPSALDAQSENIFMSGNKVK